jgi:hypothetical protein
MVHAVVLAQRAYIKGLRKGPHADTEHSGEVAALCALGKSIETNATSMKTPQLKGKIAAWYRGYAALNGVEQPIDNGFEQPTDDESDGSDSPQCSSSCSSLDSDDDQ